MKYPYSTVEQNCLSVWICISMVIDYKFSMTSNGSMTFETGSTHRSQNTEDWQTLGTNETEGAVQGLGKGCNEVSKR